MICLCLIVTVDKRLLFFRNLSTMNFGKVEAKQVGRFPFQRLDLEDGFQVEGWGKPGEGNRRMWPSRKNA